ncbi:MAG: B12-binding domain-containing radical SAM protein [Armatimonadetes bacterium]|nr:B12-binding domain-containing radical SAM protein [Armatimonadota bacterium]MDW8029195.1 radical SAM protein [Armatimonadota bacterium]
MGKRFTKRVVMIEPRSPRFHVFNFVRLPRLGLPILGAILKQQGYDVTIFCEDLEPIDWNFASNSDIAFISTITCTAPRAYEISRFFKERKIPVVMGGPHPTFLPEDALKHCDYVVRGEGEETVLELMQALENGSKPYGIKGVSFRDGDEIVHNPLRPLVQNLDFLPFPDLSLICGKEKISLTPILTSRGCPYDCTFCSVTHMFGHKFRRRSVENVMEELRRLKPRSVFFYDDIFNADSERMASLLEAMLSEGITPDWSAQCHTHLILKQSNLLPLMKRSGCFALYLGFESINPATLKEYCKRQTVEEIREAIRLLHKHGIMVHGMFVFGADTDELATFKETVKFALRNRIDTAQFLILTPVPGTQLFKRLENEGRILTRDWRYYDGHHVVFKPVKISPVMLQLAAMKAMRAFYSLTAIAHYSLAIRDWVRDVTKAFSPILKGKLMEFVRKIFHTREIVSVAMRLYGWWQLKFFAKWQKQFVRWLEEQWNNLQQLRESQPPTLVDEKTEA